VISLGNTTVQLESVPEMRGRVMALWSVAMVGSTALGGPIIGFIGEHMGARWGLAIGGVVTTLTVGFLMLSLLKKDTLEEIPESVQNRSDRTTPDAAIS
jgi:MFS family permease